MVDNQCKKCKKEMKQVREEIIADTKYNVLKCEKCNIQIARTAG